MVPPLSNLKSLRDDMIANDWVIAPFAFTYKRQGYFVLVTRYVPSSSKPDPMALVELTFIDKQDVTRTLATWANSYKVGALPSEVKKFFRVNEWVENFRDFMQQFYTQLGPFVPTRIPATLTLDEKHLVLRNLDLLDREDPNKLYCFDVRRQGLKEDGARRTRSVYNSQKTAILMPELYEQLKDDKHLSFYYSTEPNDQRSTAEILARFAARH